MNGTRSVSAAVPPWAMAVAAMLSIQFGSALSVGLIDAVGAPVASWLRLSFGALIFLLVARPPLRSVSRRDILPIILLGIATGVMVMAFLEAIARIELGTAVAIEFTGPLAVAALMSDNRKMLIWPALALVGVFLLGEPWQGELNLHGVGFAALAGVAWGCYILLTQKVGDRFSGISGLSMTIPIAAIFSAFIGVPQLDTQLSWGLIGIAIGAAVLAPALPFALEMLALRRMSHTAFGTLMALEPAFGVLVGLVILHQIPSTVQGAGLLLVVIAGACAQRGGQRRGQLLEVDDSVEAADSGPNNSKENP